MKKKIEDYAYCHPCQIRRGAKTPRGGLIGITTTWGECSLCKQTTQLIPTVDYHWPKLGKRAVWD